MAIPTDPNTLAALSTCYRCIPEGDRGQVLIYILADAAGLSGITAAALMEASKCYCGIPEGDQAGIFDYLMTQIANGGGEGSCAALSGEGDPTGVETPDFSGQLFHDTDADEYYRSTGLTNADWVIIGGTATPQIVFDNNALTDYTEWNGSADSFPSDATAISLPGIESISSGAFLDISNLPLLTSVSLSELTTIGGPGDICGVNIQVTPGITSLNFSSLTSIGSGATLQALSCPLLTTLLIGNFLCDDEAYINFSGGALPEATVDFILARCVASAGFEIGEVMLDGGTNATPSAQGLIDKATLQGRGVTVNTN